MSVRAATATGSSPTGTEPTCERFPLSTAKISTFGHRVVDVFYVKDQFGLKIESEARLKAIRDSLMQVLQEREADFAPARKTKPVVTAAQ